MAGAAYAGAVAFGAAVGVLRILGGGHFFSDIAFAGVFMFLVAWLVHGLLLRWRLTRPAKGAVERVLARIGEAMYGVVGRPKPPEQGAAFSPAALPEQLGALPHTAASGDDFNPAVPPLGET